MDKMFAILVLMISIQSYAQTTALKPGQYKVKTTATMSGPAADSINQIKKQIESLPKEAQAQALKQLGDIQPSVHTQETEQCLTQADLDYESFVRSLNKDQQCKVTTVKKSAKEFSTKTVCKNGGQTDMSIKVINSTSYSFEGEGKHNGKTLTQVKGTGTWTVAKCTKKKN